MASACGRMNRKTALLNAVILWATSIAVSAWLLSSGVSGMFGVAASNSGEVLNQVQQPGGLSLPNQRPAQCFARRGYGQRCQGILVLCVWVFAGPGRCDDWGFHGRTYTSQQRLGFCERERGLARSE